MTCGIYAIENMVNGNVYVGQSSRIERRWYHHRYRLNGREPGACNKHFLAAWNKYGEESFLFYILEECPSDQLTRREQHWADTLRQQGKELYNAGRFVDATSRGQKMPPETRSKISAANKGKNKGKDNPMYGKKRSAEDRARISEGNKGEKNGQYGKKRSAEDRARISEKLKGKQIGRIFSPETIEKLSGENNSSAKLTWEQVREIRLLHSQGKSAYSLAKIYPVSRVAIRCIVNRRTWIE
ncbi:MAG TPA: NUMOD3 domain-containing DNA-binding protein [Myxococcota bacterium]|nr:NUMOD3 domain-containing DNA-binding protein [Myxococcota bacterium]HRV17864.1 NUMOD3 domain-containing DNA-binding protein [Myxococcota bacterium]